LRGKDVHPLRGKALEIEVVSSGGVLIFNLCRKKANIGLANSKGGSAAATFQRKEEGKCCTRRKAGKNLDLMEGEREGACKRKA